MMTYKLAGKHAADAPSGLAGTDIKRIIRKEDNAFIPFDPANTDYQEYLEWVAAGNTAEAAD
tara:strand:- start:168 stop:353 length:186 start_codon:yes stop_codon:yes gene_type:complete